MDFGSFAGGVAQGYSSAEKLRIEREKADREAADFRRKRQQEDASDAATDRVAKLGLVVGREAPADWEAAASAPMPAATPAAAPRSPMQRIIGAVAQRLNPEAAAAKAGIGIPAPAPAAPAAPAAGLGARAPVEEAPIADATPAAPKHIITALDTAIARMHASQAAGDHVGTVAAMNDVNKLATGQAAQDIQDAYRYGGLPKVVEMINLHSPHRIGIEQNADGTVNVLDESGKVIHAKETPRELVDQATAQAMGDPTAAQSWLASRHQDYNSQLTSAATADANSASAAESRARAGAIPTQAQAQATQAQASMVGAQAQAINAQTQSFLAQSEAALRQSQTQLYAAETGKNEQEIAVARANAAKAQTAYDALTKWNAALNVADPLLDDSLPSLANQTAMLNPQHVTATKDAEGNPIVVNPFNDALAARTKAYQQRLVKYNNGIQVRIDPASGRKGYVVNGFTSGGKPVYFGDLSAAEQTWMQLHQKKAK